MAAINVNLSCDLQKPIKVQYLDGILFSQDNQANIINVGVFDGGEPAVISGTVTANIIRSDGGTVAATGGTITDNICSIALPSAAYYVPGVVSIVVKLTTSGVITTIAAVVANVYQSSTDTVVDPGTIIPSIQTLIASIETAVASIPADYSSLWTSLAPAFSSSANYVSGQYVTYNGGVYRFNTTHTGAWAAGDVSAVNIGGELTDLKSALSEETENVFRFDKIEPRSLRENTLFTKYPDNSTIDIRCTAALSSSYTIYPLPSGVYLESGKTYKVKIEILDNVDSSLNFILWRCKTDQTNVAQLTNGTTFTPASNNILKLIFNSGSMPNGRIRFYIALSSDSQDIIVPNLTATDYVARRKAEENRNLIASNNDTMNQKVDDNQKIITENTENLFFFDNIQDRTVVNGTDEIDLAFRNNSTIKINSDGELDANFTLTSVMGDAVLEAGKTYIFRSIKTAGSVLNYDVVRYNASTSADIGALAENKAFTPSVDSKVKLKFYSGYSQIGEVSIYIAEYSKAVNENVPNLTAVDYVARSQIGKNTMFDDRYITDCSGSFIKGAYIALNGVTADINNPVQNKPDYGYAVIPCVQDEKFRVVSFGQSTPRAWGFIDNNGTVLTVADAITGYNKNRYLDPVDLVAPANSAYLIVNHYYTVCGYNPIVVKLSELDIVNYVAEKEHQIPMFIKPEWKRYVVAVYKTMLITNIAGVLRISKDCGISWSDGLNVSAVGLIKSYHLYANGCLGFFTQTKAYYTEDFTSYSEATCYEADGTTVYTPAELENFYFIIDTEQRMFIGSQDVFVFGNYVVNGEGITRPLIWYSIDNGHTYKIAYEFNAPGAYTARHVHFMYYYEATGKYLMSVGDNPTTDSRVFEVTYDPANDEWSLSVIGGPSKYFQWAYISVWGDYIYFTYDLGTGAVCRCKYADLGDVSKHEIIFKGTTTNAVCAIIGPMGDMIVTQSWHRGNPETLDSETPVVSQNTDCRKIFYSEDRKTFYGIYIDPQIMDGYTSVSGFLPITSDGHVICGAHNGGGTTSWGKLPSLYLDDYVRLAGFKNAFRPVGLLDD